MNVIRVCALLGIFVGIAVTVVHLRAEQTRCAARIVSMEAQWVTLRRELWGLQTRTARLKSPELLHDRTRLFQTGLAPPGVNDLPERPARFAFRRP